MAQINQKPQLKQLYLRRVNCQTIKILLDFKSNNQTQKILQIIEKELKIPRQFQILMNNGKQILIDEYLRNFKPNRPNILHVIDQRNLTKSQNKYIDIFIKKLDGTIHRHNIPGNMPVVQILKQYCFLKGYALRQNFFVYAGIGLKNSSTLYSSKVQNGSILNLLNQYSLSTHCQKAEQILQKIVSLSQIDTVKKLPSIKSKKNQFFEEQFTKNLFEENEAVLLQTIKWINNPDKKLEEVQCKYIQAISQPSFDGRTQMSSQIINQKNMSFINECQISHFKINDPNYDQDIPTYQQNLVANKSQVFSQRIPAQLELPMRNMCNSCQQQQHQFYKDQESDISFSNLYSKYSKFQTDQVINNNQISQKKREQSKQAYILKFTDSVEQNQNALETNKERRQAILTNSNDSSQDSNIVWRQEAHEFRESQDFTNLFKESNNDIQKLMGEPINFIMQESEEEQSQIKFNKRYKIADETF